MRVNSKGLVLALVTALFVLSLVFGPSGSFARKPEDKKDRSASTKPESKSGAGKAESESARERNNQRKPLITEGSTREKPGALKRIANLFKGLVVPRSKSAKVSEEGDEEGDDPDLPRFLRGKIDEAEYRKLRDEQIASLRGVEPGKPFDFTARGRAIVQMERQMAELTRAAGPAGGGPQPQVAWTPLGPAPIPNGQTDTAVHTVSGRLTTMVVDPTNSNILYVGAAHGGVWRSLDGGTTFTSIFDSASSLAIGALTLDPNDHTRLWVGTGEPNGSADSFAGVGLYRVDTANTAPVLNGPINPVRSYLDASSVPQMVPVFNGRSISKILVNPLDSSVLFVSTAGGVIGLGDTPFGNTIPPLGIRGLYRLSAATGPIGAIGVERIKVSTSAGPFDTPNTGNRNVNDMVFDPADATFNTLIVWQNGTSAAGDGGVWRSTNALAAPGSTVAFTQTLATTSASTSNGRGQLAIYKRAAASSVVYVASGETTTGDIKRSVDGGVTWSAALAAGNGFCGAQCFYNIGFAVVGGATTATDRIHLGGNVTGASSRLHGRSLDGGATFTNLATGLHADTHFIYVDPTTNTTVYHLNDGGIWKSTDSGATWTSLNSNGFNVTQFQSLAIHVRDRNFTIGGTQDNGTECLGPCNQVPTTTWIRADFGDGGFALVDQTTTSTSTLTMYHTYFNQSSNLLGFARTNTTACAKDANWAFKGIYGGAVDPTVYCDGSSDTFNGIGFTDSVRFYAPMALGPGGAGNPNTVYYGSNKLYRSANRGDTMPAVSQTFASTVASIGISPFSDGGRLVGLTSGSVFATTTGANPMVDVTSNLPTPLKLVARAIFDPNDATLNTAYVTLGGYWGAATGHVFKTTNLNNVPLLPSKDPVTPTAAVVWTAASSGIPDVPVNALVVDPSNSLYLYAGTDIGVYQSTNGGATWAPYGTGLPIVAVFDMVISNPNRILKIATHGRGIWEISIPVVGTVPTAAPANISGGIADENGNPVAGVSVALSGSQSREAITDSNGQYSFDSVGTNGFYTVTPSRVNYSFTPASRSFSLLGVHTEASFTASANGDRTNAIDTTEFFVRQQYLDFLNREPDAPGFAGWVSTLRNCAAGDASCDRVHVSESFYRSQEFQERGYFAYRFYSVALGRKPDYAEFTPDLARVSGFLTNDQLEAAKTALIDQFMARPAFASQYNSLGNAAYVDALINTSGVSLANRQSLIDGLNAGTQTRAQVLRQVAESGEVYQRYYNQAFVVMEYFGYLHRDPDALYAAWIAELDRTGSARQMVDGFVNSTEYRNRFAQ